MFQDSNKEYTGSSAGVVGGKPATPVSLSPAQEAAAQAAVAAALEQLQRQQQVVDVQTTQAQLYQIVREMVQSKQQSIEPHVVVEQWEKKAQPAHVNPTSARTAVQQEEVSSTNKGGENYSQKPGEASPKSEPAPVEKTPVEDTANTVPVVNGTSEQSAKESTDEQGAEDKSPGITADGAGLSGSEPQAETSDSNESTTPNSAQAVREPQQSSSASQTTASNPSTDNQAQGPGSTPTPEPAPAGQEMVAPSAAPPDGHTATADKGASDEAPAPSQTADALPPVQEPGAGTPAAGSETPATPQAPIAPTDHQSLGGGKEGEPPPSSPVAQTGEAHQLPDESGGQQYKKEGLPTGARERFKRGFEDRKSGQGFKDAYSARKLPPGGSAVKGLGEGAAKGAAENLAKEGAKDVAATAAKAAAKEGVKDTAKLASKTTPVGLLTDIDAKGAYKAAKDLKNFKVVSAAKGVAQSAAVTLFRVSYDPWVIGFTVGLSLIVTLIVGSVIFLMPSSSMTFLERLLVVALWLLLGLAVLLILGLLLVGLCNGPQGWAIWGASFFSKTAADINKFCEPIGALQAATKNVAR